MVFFGIAGAVLVIGGLAILIKPSLTDWLVEPFKDERRKAPWESIETFRKRARFIPVYRRVFPVVILIIGVGWMSAFFA
jgi:hypothetical protein